MTTWTSRGWCVVTIDGDADHDTAEQLRAALEEAATASRWLVLDCAALTFCDSSFLAALIAAHKRARADRGSLVLAGPQSRLASLLARTGLHQVLPVYPDLTGAVANPPTAP